MRKIRGVESLVAISVIGISTLSFVAPAYADDIDDSSTIGEADEGIDGGVTDLPGAATPTLPPGMSHPGAEHCDPGWVFVPETNYGRKQHVVGPTLQNDNDTSKTAKSTFTSEATATVGISVSGSAEVSGGVFIAAVKSTYAITLSTSLTAKIGNNISVNTGPHSTTYATYGVWRQKVKGHNYYFYSNCAKGQSTHPTVYGPRTVGWRIWEK